MLPSSDIPAHLRTATASCLTKMTQVRVRNFGLSLPCAAFPRLISCREQILQAASCPRRLPPRLARPSAGRASARDLIPRRRSRRSDRRDAELRSTAYRLLARTYRIASGGAALPRGPGIGDPGTCARTLRFSSLSEGRRPDRVQAPHRL